MNLLGRTVYVNQLLALLEEGFLAVVLRHLLICQERYFFSTFFFCFDKRTRLNTAISNYFSNGKDLLPSQEPVGKIMWPFSAIYLSTSLICRRFLFECNVNKMACPKLRTEYDVFVHAQRINGAIIA